MKIEKLRTGHLECPLGYDLNKPVLSYVVTGVKGKRQEKARIVVSTDEKFHNIVHDSGMRSNISNLGYVLEEKLEPSVRYFWKVYVCTDEQEEGESETTWFETPKSNAWIGKWITPVAEKNLQVTVIKDILITKRVKKARIYMTGLGVYELYLNGKKQGNEYLMPGLHTYDSRIAYQTYEIFLKQGKNIIEVMLGDGWYKGRFGLEGREENYGDFLSCIADIAIWYEDGTSEIIGTDETWKARRSHVVKTGIYYGEYQDETLNTDEVYDMKIIDRDTSCLCPRLSPPLTSHENLKPVEIIHTPAGETVLDFGQNMVGWVSFTNTQKKGKKLYFQFGELLQNGNFYRDNLRSAEAEFTYISNGVRKEVRPHFTFFGFRYVKVCGWEGEMKPQDFTGVVIHSEMEEKGTVLTSDSFVNRLFQNTRWGQKGNFLDVPTDCPQRDERMGWMGDAQIFSGTACYNMDVYAFYRKYGRDIWCEQKKLHGVVPDVVPMAGFDGHYSAAWGDAAVIIPWNTYLHYGDKEILEKQYESMKGWIEFIKEQEGGERLWKNGSHYGDWLALDGRVEGGVFGATDIYMIASAYYYYSTDILRKTAGILGLSEDEEKYEKLALEIKKAFQLEYFTETGRLSVDTMTAYVIVLYMNLVPENARERICHGLFRKLQDNDYKLCTGFVGTPYLCRVLSQNGMNELAYRLLLDKEYPGWLYEVVMGATTIWERWNSVLPDGRISGTEMNSMNHYSYGAVIEWMYRYMIGIQPVENMPGFKKTLIAPKPCYMMAWAEAECDTAAGLYKVRWELNKERIKFIIHVPFDCEADMILPDASVSEIEIKGSQNIDIVQDGADSRACLVAGDYEFSYIPSIPYRKVYTIDSLVSEIMEDERASEIFQTEFLDKWGDIPFQKETSVLRDLLNTPIVHMTLEEQQRIDGILRKI